jgi:hypothetical protein
VLTFADLFGSGSDLEINASGSMHDSSRRHSRDNSVSNSTHLISNSSNSTATAATAGGGDATASNTAANATTTTAANGAAVVGKKCSSDKVLRMFVWRYERFFALPGTPGKRDRLQQTR